MLLEEKKGPMHETIQLIMQNQQLIKPLFKSIISPYLFSLTTSTAL